MINTLEGKQELPDWLVISQTLLLAKTTTPRTIDQ